MIGTYHLHRHLLILLAAIVLAAGGLVITASPAMAATQCTYTVTRNGAVVYKGPGENYGIVKRKDDEDNVTSPWRCGQFTWGDDGYNYAILNLSGGGLGYMRTTNLCCARGTW